MFCSECGEKLNPQSEENNKPAVLDVLNNKKIKVGIIAGIAAVVVAVILIVILAGGNSMESAVEKYMDAQINGDAKAVFELIPDELVEYMLDEEGYDEDEFDIMIEDLNEEFQNGFENVSEEIGEGWDVTYEIENSKRLRGDDLDELQEFYEDFGLEVSEARKVNITLEFTADDLETTNSIRAIFVNIGNSWYLDVDSAF